MPEDYGQGNGYPSQPQQPQWQPPQQQPTQGMPQQAGYYGGYPQGGPQQASANGQWGYPGAQAPKREISTGALIGIIVGCVALLGVLALVAVLGRQGAPDDTTTGKPGITGTPSGTGTADGTDDGTETGADGDGTSIDLHGSGGDVQATGSTGDGAGWVTYRNPEAAAQDIGYALDIPTEAYGRKATDFLVRTDDAGDRYLWFEYWDDDLSFEEFGVVAKMKDNFPPMYGTTENEHQIDNGDNFIIAWGDDSETVAMWVDEDDSGDGYGYCMRFNQKLSDEEIVRFVNQVK